MKWFLSLFILVVFNSCSNYEKIDLEKYSWITGEWHYNGEQYVLYENWKWDSEKKHFFGTGSMILNDVDTVYSQEMNIGYVNKKIFLSVKSSSEGVSKEAFFELNQHNEKMLTFRNKFSAYPRFITYRHLSNGIIETKAVGIKEGKNHSDIRVLLK
ncbi:MAG: hypothetical protein N4A45_13560 [Flavobacteriales bacterium]|jgi:hypothetical protein|nr:hypothetical protein [Flavobacteriales bacterium]